MGRGPDVTSNPEHDNSVAGIFTWICGKGWESSSKNCQPGALKRGCSNSANLQEVLRFMSYRFYLEMIVLKRRIVESDGSISWKWNAQRSSESAVYEFVYLYGPVLCISNQIILFDAWIFRKRKEFYWLHGLSKTNLVKTTFLSIHAAVVGSNLRNSSQRSKQRQKAGFFINSELIFLSKCSLPWYV